jgi:hypothetical protein
VDQIDSSHYESFSVPSYVFESKGCAHPSTDGAEGLTLDRGQRHNIVLEKRFYRGGAGE